MGWMLNVCYGLALLAASPFLAWRAWRHGKPVAGWSQKLTGDVPRLPPGDAVVWWHAVSVGEVNLLAPLLAEVRRRNLPWRCVVSTTTLTGFNLARKKYPDLVVFYCPFDFTWAVHRAIGSIRPKLLVLAELELWPNLIAAAKAAGAKTAVVNGRLSERSFRGYRRIAPLLRPILRKLDLVAAQTPEYAQRFVALGTPESAVRMTGNVKFDGLQSDRNNSRTTALARLAGIAPGDVVFLAGSTQAPEERIAGECFQSLAKEFPNLRLIVVPRHPERFEEAFQTLRACACDVVRRSSLRAEAPPPAGGPRVLLVDTIGELGAWWGTAHLAFVGGSLGDRGGQNMLEPAAYGAAVCFGPNTRNFRDVVQELRGNSAAEVVRDRGELTAFLRRGLTDPTWAARLGAAAQATTAAGRGAAKRTVDLLEELLPTPASPPSLRPKTADAAGTTGKV